MAKNPEDRWQSAHDLRDELKWIAEEDVASSLSVATVGVKPAAMRAWGLAALLVLSMAVLTFAVIHLREKPEGGVTARFQFSLPQHVDLGAYDSPVVSPDGERITFAAIAADGLPHLWVRRLDSLGTEVLPGSERGRTPFWSPDSKSIGFFARGELKRIDLSGGPPQTLCNAPAGWSGAWNRDGVILFGDMQRGALYSLSAAWGEACLFLETLNASKQ